MTERIFHYTTASGLLGILDSKEIWMTDIRYLNDTTEFTYFSDLTRNRFLELKKTMTSDEQVAVGSALNQCYELLERTNIYLASFSEEEDSLPQWRGYCGSRGYNIGFNKDVFLETLKFPNTGDGEETFYLKVSYDVGAANSDAERIINSCLAAFKVGQLNDLDSLRLIIPDFYKSALTHKHKAFKEEKEWRFVSIGEYYVPGIRSTPIFFRESGGTLTPFIKASITNSETGLTMANSISIGPGHNIELQKSALTNLLKKHGIDTEIEIKESGAPFRHSH